MACCVKEIDAGFLSANGVGEHLPDNVAAIDAVPGIALGVEDIVADFSDQRHAV